MSMGYGASAVKRLEDEKTVIYSYGVYNLNEQGRETLALDGEITIKKSCFVSPDIYEKIKRLPNGKKKHIIKRRYREVDADKSVSSGQIEVVNCSSCFGVSDTDGKTDIMALRLLGLIFRVYQENDVIPEQISYNV